MLGKFASLKYKARIIYWALANSERFSEEEGIYNARFGSVVAGQETSSLHKIRHGLLSALKLCLVSLAVGAIVGVGMRFVWNRSTIPPIAIIILGTAILLWATLSFQGWSIQTFKGATLAERLNQWIFRSLYCLGTVLITAGSVWSIS